MVQFSDDVFIEQAEYLERDRLDILSHQHPDEKKITSKLLGTGAKLVVGPRGSGKTTLLLKAYGLALNKEDILPIYVNFKTSLKIEPLYKTNANASYWFSQWLFLKIVGGIAETLRHLNSSYAPFLEGHKKILSDLELGKVDSEDNRECLLTLELLKEIFNKSLESSNRRRIIILMDDAAHAFSAEQQRDFFDFFRLIKSNRVSPKAAIYPGVTSFSSAFHVGHDAEEIDVWINPNTPQYIPFMRSILEKRIPKEILQKFKDPQLIDLICYSAFGIPRNFLNMIRSLVNDEDSLAVNSSPTAVLKSIKENYESSLNMYLSLKDKLPYYKNFILSGEKIFLKSQDFVKEFNKSQAIDKQSVSIALKDPISAELSKVIGFLQYSGLVFPMGTVSRGVKGKFNIYYVHFGALVTSNSIVAKKGKNIGTFCEALSKRDAHKFTRVSEDKLISAVDDEVKFTFTLPLCHVCKHQRSSESAKFCMNCGAPLKEISIFNELIEADISVLPLTATRIDSIKRNSSIKKIKDIIFDHNGSKLLSVKQIGPHWAKKIFNYAEEFIA